MATEEVKNFNFNVGSVQAGQGTSGAAGTSSSNTAIRVFEEFKKFAKSRGVDITPEDFVRVINQNPELINNPSELLKRFKTSDTEESLEAGEVQPVDNETAEVSQETEPSAEQSGDANLFTSLSESQLQVLSESIQEVDTVEEQAAAQAEAVPAEESATQEPVQAQKTNHFANIAKNSADETIDGQTAAAAEAEKKSDYSDFEKANDTSTGLDGEGYNSKAFSNLNEEQKLQTYTSELARNRFIYSSPRKTLEEWNNLSDAERQKFINEASEIVKRDLENSKETVQKMNLGIEFSVSNNLDYRMIQLQAANRDEISLDDFKNKPEVAQGIAIADMLAVKSELDPDRLSETEINILNKANFVKDAVNEAARKKGINNEICFEEISLYANNKDESKKINIGVAIRDKLASIPDDKKTYEQKAIYKFLNDAPADYLKEFGTHIGETSALERDVLNDKEFSDRYRNADASEKAKIKAEYFTKLYGDNPEKLEEYLKSSLQTLEVSEAIALIELAKDSPTIQKYLAQVKGDSRVAISGNVEVLGESAAEFQQNINGDKDLTHDEKVAISLAVSNSASGIQLSNSNLIKFLSGLGSLVLDSSVAKNIDKKIDDETQRQQAIDTHRKSISQESLNHISTHADEFIHQIDVLGGYTKDNAEATEAAINSGVTTRLKTENQLKGFSILQNNAEILMPKEQAVASLQKLADQVSQCDKDNQLGMHKSISLSKYDEVTEYAAGNIYKYDKSVQAMAVQVTYETGNTKAIEAMMGAYTKLDPEVQQTITAAVLNNATYMQMVKNIVGDQFASDTIAHKIISNESDAVISKSEKEKFFEKWNTMSTSEKYSFMCSISVKYLGKMSPTLRRKVMEYAQKDPDLMSRLIEKYGMNLLSMTESPPILGIIVSELWHNPDNRLQIAKEVCKSPDKFPTNIVKECEFLLASRHNNITEAQFNNLSKTEQRQAANNSSSLQYESLEYDNNYTSSLQSGGSVNNRVFNSNSYKKEMFYMA